VTVRARHLLGVLGTCSALALGSCGSSEEPEGDPLPAGAVAELQKRLGEIERRYQDAVDNGNVGACNDIGSNSLPAVEDVIAGLPQSVDPELRTAVEESFARLGELAEAECADIEPAPKPAPEPAPEPVPAPEPEPEETVPEETVPQETAPEEEIDPELEEDSGGKPSKPPKPEKPPKGGGGIEVPPGLEENG
jgi:hypothetical protein